MGPRFPTCSLPTTLVYLLKHLLSKLSWLTNVFANSVRFLDRSVYQNRGFYFYSSNTDPDLRNEICQQICIDQTEDSGVYLGVPTISNKVNKETYAYLCEKIDCRLAGWKTKYLSLAGRVTLAKSTISTLANLFPGNHPKAERSRWSLQKISSTRQCCLSYQTRMEGLDWACNNMVQCSSCHIRQRKVWYWHVWTQSEHVKRLEWDSGKWKILERRG